MSKMEEMDHETSMNVDVEGPSIPVNVYDSPVAPHGRRNEESVAKGDEAYFSQKLRVRIKDNNNSPHGKFHRFLFPFSSKVLDLNFASYVLYNLPVLCHVSHTASLGYL